MLNKQWFHDKIGKQCVNRLIRRLSISKKISELKEINETNSKKDKR
jgi:chorismate mutase